MTFTRLAMDAGSIAEVAAGDGETHCSKFRSDNVWNETSCGAKYRQSHAFTSLEQRSDMGVVTLPVSFWPWIESADPSALSLLSSSHGLR